MVQELTAANFQKDVMESAVPVLVDFWSPTCGPCRLIGPVIDEIAREAGGRFRVGKINVWEQQALAVRYRLSAVPTLLIFKGGAVVNTLVGYQDKRTLLEALEPALNAPVA
jgi:thioredoxin 1